MFIFVVSVSPCIHQDDGGKATRDAWASPICAQTFPCFEFHIYFVNLDILRNQNSWKSFGILQIVSFKTNQDFFFLFLFLSICEFVASQQMVGKRSKLSRDTILGKTFSCQGEHLTNFYSTNPLALFNLTWHNEDLMLAECTMFTLDSLPKTQSILQSHRLLL